MFCKCLITTFYWICVPVFSLLVCVLVHVNNLEEIIKFGPEPGIKLEYEVIIVGAGAAGSTILSEIKSDDVLLIEAGDELFSAKNTYTSTIGNLLLKIPVLTPLLQRHHFFDWHYKTEPQELSANGLRNRISYWPIGKGYGGSQLINNMIYYRGDKSDFRTWFTKTPENYNFDKDILPHFVKLEKDNEVNELRFVSKFGEAVLNATREFDKQNVKPMNVASSTFFKPKVTQKNGERWTFGDNYHYKQKEGHKILFGARVDNIIIDKKNNDPTKLQATGLIYRQNGRLHTVYASKKIILSAGPIGSPIILLKSGIGPSELYEKLDNQIKLVKNVSAVGQHLQDHVTTGLNLVLLKEDLKLNPWNILSPINVLKYFVNGTGSMTIGGCDALGFIKTNDSVSVPNLGFVVIPGGASTDGGAYMRNNFNIKDSVWLDYYKPLVGKPSASIMPVLLHPKSRGQITLRRHFDNKIHVSIDPKYLTVESDLDVLVTGIRVVQELLKTKPMKQLGAELNTQPFPGCEVERFDTDSYWRCYIRHLTLTVYHPVGTCRIGFDKNSSVVRPDTFQVHDIDNLYICDASVMPNLPSGNTQAVVGMLAKRFLSTIADE